MKEADGPVDDDKGDRQQWVVDNCEPADFQLDPGSHVLCQAQGGVFFQLTDIKYVYMLNGPRLVSLLRL